MIVHSSLIWDHRFSHFSCGLAPLIVYNSCDPACTTSLTRVYLLYM